jgi:hypothetical protein
MPPFTHVPIVGGTSLFVNAAGGMVAQLSIQPDFQFK